MEQKEEKTFGDIAPEYFGPLRYLLEEDSVTDIDFNGHQLWVTDCRNHRWEVRDHQMTRQFMEQFSQRLANHAGRQFNRMNPLLETETGFLRISMIHESIALSGRSICIRKSMPEVRIRPLDAVLEHYCSASVMQLLANCILTGANLIFCGEPGAGKTECARFFSGFIPENQRVITIEETPEWHYREGNPGKDCVELRVDETFSYTQALRASLRQNPNWIMLSEARGKEVKSLLECFSCGVHGLTTLHTDDTRNVPDRVLNMMESRVDADRMENDVYTFVDAAILLCRKGERRFIDQICFFSRENGENIRRLVLFQGKRTGKTLPQDMLTRMKRAGIGDPWHCPCVESLMVKPENIQEEKG